MTLVQCKIHHNQFKPKRRGTIPSSIQLLHVLSMKQEINLKEFSSLPTVKDTAEEFTKPFLQEECRNGARTNNPLVFMLLRWVPSVWIFFVCSIEDVVYFFLASPCMYKLLSNRWLGLACLLSAKDHNTLCWTVLISMRHGESVVLLRQHPSIQS